MEILDLSYPFVINRKHARVRLDFFLETNFLEFTLRERVLQMPLKDRGLSDRKYRLYHPSSPHCHLYRDTLTCCVLVCVVYITNEFTATSVVDRGFLCIS
jgi:hypothetical protein